MAPMTFWPRQAWQRAALLLAVFALALLAWQGLRAPLLEVIELKAGPLRQTLQFSARVQSPRRVELGSTLTGRVTQVALREGERLRQGQVLLQLEDSEWRAALEQARAQAVQAREKLRSQREQGLLTAQAQLAQAQATELQAQRDWQRTQQLVQAGFLSPSRLDEGRRSLEVAQAQQRSAQAQLDAQLRQGSEAAAALAQWQAAEAAVRLAQSKLEQAQLRAVADGVLLERLAEPGQIVQPGKVLLSQSVDGPQELIALVDERYLGQLKPGQPAKVLADAYPNAPFDAELARLAPQVDAQRGAVQVWLRLAGSPPVFVREDMTLSVELLTGAREHSLLLPLAALRVDEGLQGQVGVLREGRVQAQSVRLGLRNVDHVEVLEGLRAGDQVLLDAQLALGQAGRAKLVTQAARRGISRDMPGGMAAGR
jgi:HlyD family secretion protein